MSMPTTTGKQDYTADFTVDSSARDVFAAVTDLGRWWSETVQGDTTAVGDVVTYEVPEVHRCTMTLTELIPDRRVVWHVSDSWLGFVDGDAAEWDGTDMVFNIEEADKGTHMRFTHRGLSPQAECFDMCSSAWGTYIASLRSVIVTGVGAPIRRTDTIDPEWVKSEQKRLRNARAVSQDKD